MNLKVVFVGLIFTLKIFSSIFGYDFDMRLGAGYIDQILN